MDDDVKSWLDEIASSKRREEDFLKEGKEIDEIYSGKKSDRIPFNILFSNTETLLPALFSNAPKPVVSRRFKKDDPLGKSSSMAATNMLSFLMDTNFEGYEAFSKSITRAVVDALLPGRGIVAVKYDADFSGGDLKWEQVCVESKHWNRVHFGFAKKWSKIPWIAYEEYIDEEEAKRLFGDEIAAKIDFTEDREDDEKVNDRHNESKGKTALVYQIWDKEGGKKIRYISPQYMDGYLKVEDDPFGLTGFFNCPEPLQFIIKTSEFLPTPLYSLYENQARELNRITRRLNNVFEAIKVRGVYDGALGDEIKRVLSGDDNSLEPTDKSSILSSEGGLDKSIWFMPIEKLISVAQSLISAREQIKHVIYEITGISDILRGSSRASETLGAQKIKESWGTLRLKRMQSLVHEYVRSVIRIMLEMASTSLNQGTWANATGLQFPTNEQKQQAQMAIQLAQMQGMQPDSMAIQAAASPSWEDVLGLLKNDTQKAYKIDIETNSTVDLDATDDKQQVSEFMNAMAQFMNGISPLVQGGSMPFEAAQSMMMAIVRKFRFGEEVEESLKIMKPPQQKEDGSAKMKQMELQMAQQAEAAKAQRENAAEAAKHQREMAAIQANQAVEMEKLKMERQNNLDEIQADRAAELAKLSASRETEKMKALIQQDTELKKAQIQAQTQIEIARMAHCAKVENAGL